MLLNRGKLPSTHVYSDISSRSAYTNPHSVIHNLKSTEILPPESNQSNEFTLTGKDASKKDLIKDIEDRLSKAKEDVNAMISLEEDNQVKQTEPNTECSDYESSSSECDSKDSFLSHALRNPLKLNLYLDSLISELAEKEETISRLQSQLEKSQRYD